MADKKVKIDIKTTADTSGAEKAEDALRNVSEATQEASGATEEWDDATKKNLEALKEQTAATQKQIDEQERLNAEIAEQNRLAAQQKQRIDDVTEAQRRQAERLKNQPAGGLGTELATGQASLAARAASLKLIYETAQAAGRAVDEMNAKLVALDGKGSESAEAFGLAMKAITDPINTIITVAFDALGESANEAIEKLKEAQEQSAKMQRANEMLADSIRERDSAAVSQRNTQFLNLELDALRRLNEERERSFRIETKRLQINRQLEDMAAKSREDQIRKTRDGAAENAALGVARGQSGAVTLQRAQESFARSEQQTRENAEAVRLELEALRTSLQLAASDAATANANVNKLPLAGTGTAEEERQRVRLAATAAERNAEKAALEERVRSAEIAYQQAQGLIEEVVATNAEDLRLIAEQARQNSTAAVEQVGSAVTESLQESIRAGEAEIAKFEAEGKAVPAAFKQALDRLRNFLKDEIPDDQQLVPIQNAVLGFRDAFRTMGADFVRAQTEILATLQEVQRQLSQVQRENVILNQQLRSVR